MNARTHGFTLLEVLIALLIFSLGVLGVGGVMVVSSHTNHGAFLRTQANFLAQGMIDRMRANSVGVWMKSYDATYSGATQGPTSACLNTAACSYADIAQRDGMVLSNQLAMFLPNALADIVCVSPTVPTSNDIAIRTPYTGQCTLTLSWSEGSLDRLSVASTQTMAWVFQP